MFTFFCTSCVSDVYHAVWHSSTQENFYKYYISKFQPIIAGYHLTKIFWFKPSNKHKTNLQTESVCFLSVDSTRTISEAVTLISSTWHWNNDWKEIPNSTFHVKFFRPVSRYKTRASNAKYKILQHLMHSAKWYVFVAKLAYNKVQPDWLKENKGFESHVILPLIYYVWSITGIQTLHSNRCNTLERMWGSLTASEWVCRYKRSQRK